MGCSCGRACTIGAVGGDTGRSQPSTYHVLCLRLCQREVGLTRREEASNPGGAGFLAQMPKLIFVSLFLALSATIAAPARRHCPS